MTKFDAVHIIIDDARAKRASKTSLKKLRRAMQVLELTDDEQHNIERRFEYRDSNNNLYTHFAEVAK